MEKNTHSDVFIMEGNDENEQTPCGEADETVYGERIYRSLWKRNKTKIMRENYIIKAAREN